jgi:hypothetical protein
MAGEGAVDAMECRAEPLRCGLYPYDSFYMDARSGQRLDDIVMVWWRAHNSHTPAEGKQDLLDEISRRLGFVDDADAQAHIVPMIPEEISDLALYAELFTDESVCLQLRPLLYTYWG